MSHFEWNGSRFTVRPLTGMDQEFYLPLLVDVAGVVCKARGYTVDDLPRVLDKLISTFVKWAQVTTIDGDALPACNLLTGDVLAYFDAWANAVTSNQELWSMWKDAFEDANRIDNDPLPSTPVLSNASK